MAFQRTTKKWLQFGGVTAIFAATLGLTVAMGEQPRTPLAEQVEPVVMPTTQSPKIQLAILLDTSSSMDGLIDQARNQLWQVVNEFSKATRDGKTPMLEVAVYEYGNDGLSAESGFIRQVVALTSDLDRVSEGLFSLKTNGGSEYCGQVILTSVRDLKWSDSAHDIKSIFIAGNEPFTQGDVSYKKAITAALKAGITVNTIHAGDYDEGVQTGWQQGALLAGGNFMSIDHNQQTVHIVAPQDAELAKLNQQLNETYVPYGAQGKVSVARQEAQDINSNNVSLGMLAKRAKTKASSFYDSSEWDLVDAMERKKMDVSKLEASALPEVMQSMDEEQRISYVGEKSEQRKQLKESIAKLAQQRDAYVAEKKKELTEREDTLDNALISSVKKEAESKRYTFQ